MVVLLIMIVASPTISSVLGSTSISNSSTHPISNFSSSSTPSIAQKQKDSSISSFKITDEIKALINDLVDKNKTNAAIEIGFIES